MRFLIFLLFLIASPLALEVVEASEIGAAGAVATPLFRCVRSPRPRGKELDRVTCEQSPLADAAWIENFARAFGEQPVIHEVRDRGRLVAALPLVRAPSTLYAPGRAWVSLDNEHTPYWQPSGRLDPTAARHFLDQLDDAEYVFLRRLPVESSARASLVAAAEDRGMPVMQIENEHGDARISLEGSFADVLGRLPKRLAKDLPRQVRVLERQGKLEYRAYVEPGPELEAALTASFAIEQLGWKATEGSPIASDPRTLDFYSNLARDAAASGRFALYTLSFDDKLIAFEYTLRGGGHIDLLKISFDPAFAPRSPGQVLRMMMLEREAERGEVGWYHMGRPSEWKRRWATEIAPLCSLRIFNRGLRGRAAHFLGPVLHDQLKHSPLVARVRQKLGR